METKRILVKNICLSDNNPRSDIGDTSDLEASIRSVGLIQPIVVTWSADKCNFEVVSGNRRLQAMKNLGEEYIDCIVNTSGSEELFRIATAENVIRKNMTPADECRAVAQMVKNGSDIRSIAAEFGHSVRWALGRQKMAELGEDIMQLVDDGVITLAHAEVLTMCSNDDEVKKFASSCRYTQPEDLKRRILNEKKNLSKAPFNVKKLCAGCTMQTVCQQDIFGDVTDSYCQDGDCFQKHLDAFIAKKTEEMTRAGYRQWEGSYDWDFKHSYSYINPDRMSESDAATVERIKKAGGKMMFLIEEDGEVIFRWKRDDDPKEEAEEEEKRIDRENAEKVRQRANELEEEAVRARIDKLLDAADNNLVAVIFDYINTNDYDGKKFGESCSVDNDDEYYEGAVANVGEDTDDGESQRKYIADKFIECFMGHQGFICSSESERAFFNMKSRNEYEGQALGEVVE